MNKKYSIFICWFTKRVIVALRRLKLYQGFFWSQWYETRISYKKQTEKTHKYVEIKQHATEITGSKNK